MSGFLSPAASKISTTWSDQTAFETICRTAVSRSSELGPGPFTPVFLTIALRAAWNWW